MSEHLIELRNIYKIYYMGDEEVHAGLQRAQRHRSDD